MPEFWPTWEEFADFSAFVARIEREGCPAGAALIHPPKGWAPRANMAYDDLDDIVVRRPIRQEVVGSRGVFLALHIEQKKRSVKEFRKEADEFARRYSAPIISVDDDGVLPPDQVLDELDRLFWRSVLHRTPMYGADLEGSLFDDDVCQNWNPKHLDTILNSLDDERGQIPGVHKPYLYIGMYGSMFCWHVEDGDLYGINYCHYGSPKTWYAIPADDRERFEELCRREFPDHFRSCDEFMRHKQGLISLDVLRKNGIRYGRVTQTTGTFTIVFGGVYHCGFNHGFNVAEAVNFASLSWLPRGQKAKRCLCRADTVKIDAGAIARKLFSGLSTKKFADYQDRIEQTTQDIRGGSTVITSGTAANTGGSDATSKSARKPRRRVRPRSVGRAFASKIVAEVIAEATGGMSESIRRKSEKRKRIVAKAEPDLEPGNVAEQIVKSLIAAATGDRIEDLERRENGKLKKRRRNWAPIPVVPMSAIILPPMNAESEERMKLQFDYRAMCSFEEQILQTATLLSLVKHAAREGFDEKRGAGLGRRISKMRKRFLNVQRGMFNVNNELPLVPKALEKQDDGEDKGAFKEKKKSKTAAAKPRRKPKAKAVTNAELLDRLQAPQLASTASATPVVATDSSGLSQRDVDDVCASSLPTFGGALARARATLARANATLGRGSVSKCDSLPLQSTNRENGVLFSGDGEEKAGDRIQDWNPSARCDFDLTDDLAIDYHEVVGSDSVALGGGLGADSRSGAGSMMVSPETGGPPTNALFQTPQSFPVSFVAPCSAQRALGVTVAETSTDAAGLREAWSRAR